MKSIDDFNNNTEDLGNESVDNVNYTPSKKPEVIKKKYKEKEVNITYYNKANNMVVFNFDDVKIQMIVDTNVDMTKDTITVKYKGTVGTSDFEIKIK